MGIKGLGRLFGGVRRGIGKLPGLIGRIIPLAGGRTGWGRARAEGAGMPSLLRL